MEHSEGDGDGWPVNWPSRSNKVNGAANVQALSQDQKHPFWRKKRNEEEWRRILGGEEQNLQSGPKDKAGHVSDEKLANGLFGQQLVLRSVQLLHGVVFGVGAVWMDEYPLPW